VSIISRLTNRHLDDAALAELWTVRTGGARETAVHPHLEQCAECRVRLSAFTSWMEDVRDDALAEADAAFPAERLAAQQAQIFKRLEAAERPARVIVFPKFPVGQITRQSSMYRWVGTGVAAGLIIGIGLGNLVDLRHLGDRRELPRVAAVETDGNGRGIVPASATVSEETMFQELEAAATPQYDALLPFDTFTPRAVDLIASSR
jgi:hypothetical protein